MTVNSTTPAAAAAAAGSSAGARKAAGAESQASGFGGSDFQTFLVMLTTQMQNQDPLNPLDSQEFAVQLATFSGVEQQVQTNDLLKTMISQIGLSNMSDLAGWVGMEVQSEAPVQFRGAPVQIDYRTQTGADRGVLAVYDAGDRLVAQAPVAAGAGSLDWAGTDASGAPLPEGRYSFKLFSYSGEEILGSGPVQSFGKVAEARRAEDGTVHLILDGGIEVPAADVSALRPAG